MKYSKVLELQEAFRKAMEELKRDAISAVHETKPLDGVKKDPESKINVFIVQFSTIAQNNFNLRPRYYSQESQIEAVEKILLKDMDFDTFMNKIHEMIRTQKAGDVQLNPNTIKALQSIL